MWHQIKPFVATLLNEESSISLKQAIIFASPHLPWDKFSTEKHFIQLLGAASVAVPYSDKIGQSMAETLLQIAPNGSLQPHIPASMWSWLNKHPVLPPVCPGRARGSVQDVVQTVRALRDIEVLTSYLLLVWSEWDCIFSGQDRIPAVLYQSYQEGLIEMCTSIREDFSGVGVGHHREGLLQRLDYVLEQLDLGSDYLRQYNPSLSKPSVWRMKQRYGELKKVLLEVDIEVINKVVCKSPKSATHFHLLTPVDRYKTLLNIYVCNSSLMSVAVSLDHSTCPEPTTLYVKQL